MRSCSIRTRVCINISHELLFGEISTCFIWHSSRPLFSSSVSTISCTNPQNTLPFLGIMQYLSCMPTPPSRYSIHSITPSRQIEGTAEIYHVVWIGSISIATSVRTCISCSRMNALTAPRRFVFISKTKRYIPLKFEIMAGAGPMISVRPSSLLRSVKVFLASRAKRVFDTF